MVKYFLVENRKKYIIWFPLILMGFMLFICLSSNSTSEGNTTNSIDSEVQFSIPINSGEWTNTSIMIDDFMNYNTTHSGNWSWAVAQPWCTGLGTYDQPYLIENMTFNVGAGQNGLWITNSFDKYFLINNVTTINTPSSYGGIKISIANNGKITNCNATLSAGYGIYVIDSTNITIESNFCNRNHIGILLQANANNNTIINNFCNDNNLYGVYFWMNCRYNKLINNTMANVLTSNQDEGLRMESLSHNNTIANNTMMDHIRHVLVDNCESTLFFNNTLGDSVAGTAALNGILLQSNCRYTTISNNTVFDTLDYGIDLDGADYNIIANNTAYNSAGCTYQDAGIALRNNAINNTVVNNTCYDNDLYGIYLTSSSGNLIQGNNLTNTPSSTKQDYGIYSVSNSNYNRIINNTCINNNDLGLSFEYSEGCTFVNNSASNFPSISKQNLGCYLRHCSGSVLRFNNFSFNEYQGMMVQLSDYLIIENNTFSDNGQNGLFINSVSFSNISNNNASNTGLIYQNVGLYFTETCNNNLISNNTCLDNDDYGIQLNNGCGNNKILNNSVGNFQSITQRFGIYLSTLNHYNLIENNTANSNDECGIFLNDNSNSNIINRNDVSSIGSPQMDCGIEIASNCKNNNITENSCNNNQIGIWIQSDCIGNYFYNNSASNTGGGSTQVYGISMEWNCWYNILLNNTCNNNVGQGIVLNNNCSYNVIEGNNASNTGGSSNQVEGIALITNCDFNNITYNLCTQNTQDGIGLYFYCDGNLLFKNNASESVTGTNQDAGIFIQGDCWFNHILNNTCINNLFAGIEMFDNCSYNIIEGNTVSNTYGGINQNVGIHIFAECDYNNITDNICSENAELGIHLFNGCSFNRIEDNQLTMNQWFGLLFENNGSDNFVIGNNISLNMVSGIYISNGCNDSIFIGNLISKNPIGIQIMGDTKNNLFYLNNFVDNTDWHAIDGSILNFWNSTLTGNMWDNYTGIDFNDNGLGDSPYISGNIIDYLPIFSDAVNTLPLIISDEVAGFSFVEGAADVVINWAITDPDVMAGTYIISYKDGAVVASGTWSSGNTISLNLSELDLEPGTYLFVLEVSDGGVYSTDEYMVIVEAQTPADNDTGDEPGNNSTLIYIILAVAIVGVGLFGYMKKKSHKKSANK